jgi:hypothetical protein
VKERRGTVGRLTGLAEGVAAAARRRQRDRAPRVLLYDAAGHPRTLASDAAEFDTIVRAAGRAIALAGERAPERDAEPRAPSRLSTDGVSVRQPRADAGKSEIERRQA